MDNHQGDGLLALVVDLTGGIVAAQTQTRLGPNGIGMHIVTEKNKFENLFQPSCTKNNSKG